MDTYQYDLVKKLSFLRFGGTEEELRAAQCFLEEIEKWGGKGELEEFRIPAYRFHTYSVKVKAPYEQTLDVLPWGCSGSFPRGGVELKLLYAEDCTEEDLYGIGDLSDTAVLVNELGVEQYKLLRERNAAAILVIWAKWHDSKETADFLQRHTRDQFMTFGQTPTFFVWAKDALEMVKREAETVHVELEQDIFENTSRNVVATIPGTEITDESVVITAHYDSVTVGTGAWDNATGTATAMYLYRHFMAHPPKRTMRFVWCGTEEQGLYGSLAYVKAHPELVEKEIKFCFNFDMCGTVLGANTICVAGEEALQSYAEAFCKEYGISAKVRRDVRSSDSACFADRGIASMDIVRETKTANIHVRYDLVDILSAKQLKKDGDFSVAMVERVVNAARLPVALGMPEDMKEKLDKYFRKDKLLQEEDKKKG